MRLSSEPWTELGTTANGRCLTARISASLKTAKGSSLSDILETNPDPKYFLSERQVQAILNKEGTSGFADNRVATDIAPTLMSASNTNGHQSGISHKNPIVIEKDGRP